MVAPSEFSPTKWCKRRLTGTEILKGLDFPVSVIQQLSGNQIKILIHDQKMVPLKCCIVLLDAIFSCITFDHGQLAVTNIISETGRPKQIFASILPKSNVEEANVPDEV